jgi:hypothetical protein
MPGFSRAWASDVVQVVRGPWELLLHNANETEHPLSIPPVYRVHLTIACHNEPQHQQAIKVQGRGERK